MSQNSQNHTAPHECTSCGALHHTAGGIPVGWSVQASRGAIWCTECTAAGIPARELAKPAPRKRKAA